MNTWAPGFRWALVAAIVCVPVATAAVERTGSSTVIHACAAKQGGALRIAVSCRKSERPVTWNATGPRGPQGLPGQTAFSAVAHVAADGTLDASHSNGVTSVTKTLVTGSTACGGSCYGFPVYCFRLATPARFAIGTVEDSVVTSSMPPDPTLPPRGIIANALNATAQKSIAMDWGCPATTDAAVIVAGVDRNGFPITAVFG